MSSAMASGMAVISHGVTGRRPNQSPMAAEAAARYRRASAMMSSPEA